MHAASLQGLKSRQSELGIGAPLFIISSVYVVDGFDGGTTDGERCVNGEQCERRVNGESAN